MQLAALFVLEIVLDPFEDFFGVLAGIGVRIDLADDAFLIDDKGCSISEAARRKNAVSLGNLLFRVGQKRIIQMLFFRELLLIFQ